MYQDRPESTEVRFGHKVVAKWLCDLLTRVQTPYRLGITGGLGTGKSTILHEALELFKKSRGLKSTKIAYVDVWKLDKDSVRRSAILRIAKELNTKITSVQHLKETLYGTFSDTSYTRPFRKTFDKAGFGIAAAATIGSTGVVYYLVGLLSTSAGWGEKLVVALATGLIALSTRLLEKSIVHIQRTFSRAPIIGAEEFEECLQDILETETPETLVVLVFDNIDRAAPDASKAILAGLSAFFDYSPQNRPRNVIIVVPFDQASACVEDSSKRTFLQDSEKMFDAVVPLPRLADEDLSAYVEDLLKKSLDDRYPDKTYNEMATLATFSPYRSPRELKHLVNEVISQITLANTMETTSDERLDSGASLLPKGSVTEHPVTLLKLIICNKIYQNFTTETLARNLELSSAFAPGDTGIDPKDLRIKSLLDGFIKATTGTPEVMPVSAAPFHFMKGPDVVLSIPAGAAISAALHMGDGEKLKSLIEIEKTPENINNVMRVFEYHRTRYKNNSQALKNTIRALIELIGARPSILSVEHSVSLASSINIVPDYLVGISPKLLCELTEGALQSAEVKRLWRTVDALYKENISTKNDQISQKNPELWSWCVDYLVTIIQQPGGSDRAALNSSLITFDLLTSPALVTTLGESYPGTFASSENIVEAAARLCKVAPNSEEAKIFRKCVEGRFAETNEFPDAENKFQLLATDWQTAANAWLASSTAQDNLEALGVIAFKWPREKSFATASFNIIRQWVKSKQAQFVQQAGAGRAGQVLDFAFTMHCAGPGSDPNITAILQSTLPQLTKEGFEFAYDYWQPTYFWKTFRELLPQPTLQLIDRLQLFSNVLDSDDKETHVWLSQSIASFSNKEGFFMAAAEDPNKFKANSELLAALGGFAGLSNDSQRIALLRLQKAMSVDFSTLRTCIAEFISRPIDKTDELLLEVKYLSGASLIEVMDIAKDALDGSPNPWNANHVAQFKWATLDSALLTGDRTSHLVDIAVERGTNARVPGDAKIGALAVIFNLWLNGFGFSEKHLKIIENLKIQDTQVDAWISAAKSKYNVKIGLLEKILG